MQRPEPVDLLATHAIFDELLGHAKDSHQRDEGIAGKAFRCGGGQFGQNVEFLNYHLHC